jgi:hypothetical protein
MWRHERHKKTRDGDERPDGETAQTLNGGIDIPPTRQAPSSNHYSTLAFLGDTVLEDELNHRNYKAAYQDPELLGYRVPRVCLVNEEIHTAHLPGRRNRGRHNHRNRQRAKALLETTEDTTVTPVNEPSFIRRCWNAIWSVQEANAEYEAIGDMQPKVDVGGDHSLFTRRTTPFNPRRVAEIQKLVAVGPDLTEEQLKKARDLIGEFADCFTLSVSEVTAIPGAFHKIHIPPDVVFPKKIPHQRPLTDPQCKYLSKAIDELLEADNIERIRPEDVKCASPITLSQKAHSNTGLSLDELCYKVNTECIAHGLPPMDNIE